VVVTHEPWIVVLSILVAVQGAYVGLSLTQELPGSAGGRRRLLLAGAAITLAVAIWSMHFVGMLAVQSAVRIDYLVLPTLISFFVCVFVVGVAVFLASSAPHSLAILAISATVMGAGIVAMHFIGMRALHANAMVHHDPVYVAASFLVGVAASGLAIYFTFIGPLRPPLAAASVALGVAISGMHYTAMAGMMLHPATSQVTIEGTAVSRDLLAVIVAIVAFGSSLAFLLALVPDGAEDDASGAERSGVGDSVDARTLIGNPALQPALAGGALADLPSADHHPAPRTGMILPVQKEGATLYLPVGRIYAVRAEAHYTTVFDGTDQLFCNLSISDVEERLDSTRFVRVHRSHIVAVEHVQSMKKSGDGAVAHLDSATPYSVPISRRRIAELRAMLDARL
jgi:NO-binding membrane sensor protein with MHYT domain